ncbi:hypothetical protein LCGC14_1705990 [marine sediment metagenome]|uniref:Uncharacterized protein n=1 Tax=marine sediment metagenome TaxID=412755 RepID=A0A0F9I478_9ZZZZ
MSISELTFQANINGQSTAVVKYIGEDHVWGESYIGRIITIIHHHEDYGYDSRLTGMLVNYRCNHISLTLCEEVLNLVGIMHEYIEPGTSQDITRTPIFNYNMPKPDKMDVKYPHVCYGCHNKLKFSHLCSRNLKSDHSNEKHLKKLWKSAVVEFYCCECYGKQKVKDPIDHYAEFHLLYNTYGINRTHFEYLYERYKNELLFKKGLMNHNLSLNERNNVYRQIRGEIEYNNKYNQSI